ncbi:UNVERIFIED_CONTAM: hypothetical protein NCL1_46557 [Trichonephila clavipes]
MLNDDEIVTSVQEESHPADDETDENEDNNNNESSKGPSNVDAFSALETAMEWYEQQSEGSQSQEASKAFLKKPTKFKIRLPNSSRDVMKILIDFFIYCGGLSYAILLA